MSLSSSSKSSVTGHVSETEYWVRWITGQICSGQSSIFNWLHEPQQQ